MNVTIPDNVNLANCKSIKFTFALSDANEGDTVKLTMAVIHKDATSNYDENMTDPVHGRITETYSDVAYGAADQQDNITYDAATGLYTTTYSLVGKSGLENAKYLMLQRNGGESAPFKLTLKTVEYTVKAAGVEEKDILDDFKVEYPITDITKLGWSNWDTETNNYATLTEKGCTIADDGEVTVPAAQWDGIAIPLDNIKGTEAKDYYVEATVKSATDAAVMVGFSGSNTLSDKSAYYPGNAMKQWGNDYYVQRAVKGWQTIKAKITVPAGKFGETRLKGTEDAGFVVKSIKVEPYTDQDLTLDNTLVLLSLPSEKTVAVGNSITLKPVASPAEADISSAVWASDNEAVATVSGGAVTAVAEGEANVSVTVGEVKATCKVTVTKEVVVAKDIKVVPSVDNAEVLYSQGTVAASGSGIEVTFNKGTGYPECVVTLAEPVDVSLYEKVIGPNGYNLKLYKEDGKSSVDYYTGNGTAVFADKADSWADGDKVAKIGIQLGKDKDSNTEDTTLLLEELTIVAKGAPKTPDIEVVPSVDNAEVLYSQGTVAASGSGIEVTFNKGTGYPECVVTLAEPVDVSLYEKVIGPNGYNLKLYKEDGKSSVDYYTGNGTAVFADKADSWADGDKVAKIGIQLGKDKDSNTEDTTLLLEKLTIVAK